MPCACSGSKNKSIQWVYVDVEGKQHSYRTEIEAMAAKVRAGGVGSVTSNPK